MRTPTIPRSCRPAIALEYRRERKLRGSQHEVARLLQISQGTIARREVGRSPVTLEALMALRALPASEAAPQACDEGSGTG